VFVHGAWCGQRGTHLLVRKHDAGGLRGALERSTELPQVLHVQRHLIRALLIACHRVESCDEHHNSVCRFYAVGESAKQLSAAVTDVAAGMRLRNV